MCFENPESFKSVAALSWWCYWTLKVQAPPLPCFPHFHLLLSFSSSPFPTLFPSLIFLLLFFPVFPGLGCHQQLSYPFPQSSTDAGMNMISHEAKLAQEHRQNQAVFLIELMLLCLIHLKEIVCRKDLSHWVRRISSHSLWSVSPLPSLSLTTWGLKQTSPLAAWCHIMVKIVM